MDQQYPIVAKIPILDTGKFEQWQFRIQQYLQHEHYALWEVIEFGDSYEVPTNTTDTTTTDTTSGETGTKLGRTVTLTAEEMQKKKNDVKARTTLPLSLPDEHQLRFSKYKNARELWAAILKTFGGNEATTKTKKNLLKQYQDTACAYIASQSSGSQIKFKDINRIDEDDMKEMYIKWNMALLSMRADKFWKRTGKKISIQGSDVAGFDKSKVECFNCHKMGHFTRECRDPRSQDRGRRDNFRQGSKAEEQAPKALMAIYGTSLPECKDDTLTDYSRPEPTVESFPDDDKKRNPFVSETVASPIIPKLFVKFVKASDSQSKSKTDETETPKKSPVKYAKQYRKTNNKPNVRGNQRNWNNLKSHQLGPGFVMKKKACFNCGDFNHLAYDCRKRVKRGTTRSQNYKSSTHRPSVHRPHGPPMRPMRSNMNVARPNRTSFNKLAHSYTNRPFQRKSAVRSQYRAPWVPIVNRNFPSVNRKFSIGSRNFPTANRKFPTTSRKFLTDSTKFSTAGIGMKGKAGSSQNNIDDKGYWDSGCSRHMTGNISYLFDYEPFNGGYVSFRQGGCKITGKGTIKTVFAPVARIEAIRLFLAYASFMAFTVYQMDVKSAFLYGTIDEEMYVMQPPGFQDPEYPARVYKVEKAMYGLHQAPRAWFQVTPKTSHLQAVKRIFRHHFIREAYEKKLIHVLKIHTDDNVADLLTKAFDVNRSTDKIKVLNAKAKGVSAAGETLSTATLAVSAVSVWLVLVLLKLLCLIVSKDRRNVKCFENQEAKMVQKQMALGILKSITG
nr:putative ribonuclease H-like domain-containing protein [Tanacetum cinerariifolium]